MPARLAPCLMVHGTGSGVGKSVLTTRAPLFGGASRAFEAYEIHAGRTRPMKASSAAPPVFRVLSRGGRAVSDADGAVGADGNLEGTYLHGVLADARVRRCVLEALAARKGVAPHPRWGEATAVDRYDQLAAIVGAALTCRRSRGSPASRTLDPRPRQRSENAAAVSSHRRALRRSALDERIGQAARDRVAHLPLEWSRAPSAPSRARARPRQDAPARCSREGRG